MFDYMPKYYEELRESEAIIEAEANAYLRLMLDIDDVFAQMFIDKASWGLARWESLVGIKVGSEYSVWDALEDSRKNFSEIDGLSWDSFEDSFPNFSDERKSSIKSRIRGFGSVNTALLKSVCESYVGGEVEVTETPLQYKVKIKFIDSRGIPSNINDLKAAVAEIMPAHLVVEYTYNYLSWNEYDAFTWTWDELDAMQFTHDQLEVYKP
ncbi:YmfQ family protein [Peribacillus butanolivorans]|uniref:putative phage tail protein n=1 Tax=Peribacillus butanolivorans TaxID=421767 RepID=UPI00207D447C|nr:putative phage tail protein [Peribacillus butanolivorans]MCO0597364.1 YmfQ family protein [Peribacillus butanolivorans]